MSEARERERGGEEEERKIENYSIVRRNLFTVSTCH